MRAFHRYLTAPGKIVSLLLVSRLLPTKALSPRDGQPKSVAVGVKNLLDSFHDDSLTITLASDDNSTSQEHVVADAAKPGPGSVLQHGAVESEDGGVLSSVLSCWSEPPASDYRVRSEKYLENAVKIESGPFLMKLVDCGLILTSNSNR